MSRKLPILLAFLVAAACGDDSTTPTAPSTPPSTTPSLTRLAIKAPSAFVDSGQVLAVGETVDLDACAVYSDLSEDCAIAATWESQQPGVATVDDGLVAGVAPGIAPIRATYQTVSATAEITVEAASAVDLSIFGPGEFADSRELEVGEEVQLRAEVELSDGSTREPENAEWRSGNTTVATVSSNGLLIGRQAGSFDLRVTAEGLTARITGIRVVSPPESETTTDPDPDPEPDSDHPPIRSFRNCTEMRSAGWTRGVNRNGGTYRDSWDSAERRTYNLNTGRDRDKDGHACET